MLIKFSCFLSLPILFLSLNLFSQGVKTEKIIKPNLWVDPAINLDAQSQNIVIWFEDQLLGSGDSYLKRIVEFEDQNRHDIRKQVIFTLKKLNEESINQIRKEISVLEIQNDITNFKAHWIVNGFSCNVSKKGLQAIQRLEGVSKIFQKKPGFNPNNPNIGPEFIKEVVESNFDINKVISYPWNIEKIRAPEVWNTFGITGKNTLNIVHDFGFKLDIPPLSETIYRNSSEIPANGIDDDGNGYIDDYHGFNFDLGSPSVNNPRMRGTIIHGNACAAMISGTFATDTYVVIGIAPESKWAPVIGSVNIEQAIEWAIEQGADTYSMSFSQPNMGAYRSHWRKIMEHGSFCGVVFISGAGNFAAGNAFAPVPIQMRNPEDIPNAVLGVAGVGKDDLRPIFSSQGPVIWNNEHYKDGQVNKPDFATLNYQIDCVDLEGNLSNQAGGNSFAGPHMAGIVSLMLSANPDLMPWEIKEILIKIAKDLGKPGFDFQHGHGFVNAYDAVNEALK